MKKAGWIVAVFVAVGAGFLCVAGCRREGAASAAGQGPRSAPMVSVNAVVVRETDVQLDGKYIASVEALEDAVVRAEVVGYIEKVLFTEGGMVEQGDLLFMIDPSMYRATVATREAELAQAQAELVRARKFNDRMQRVDPRSVSQSDQDKAESDLLSAEAGVKRAMAALETARIDLERTEIRAPISGRIGVAESTKGNYVTPASGALARIVRLQPIRVVFSLTDREYLAFRQQELSGSAKSRVARIRLPDGTMLPNEGEKDFDDNAMNPATGTIAVRYLFDNPDGLLVPGGYVTALLHNADGETGILIPQRAIMTNQSGTYVLTVDGAGTVSETPVVPGQQIGMKIAIQSGLKTGDRVIVDGVQKAHPGATVQVSVLEEE